MVTLYQDGSSFIEENKEFLNQEPLLTSFFFLDAQVIPESNQQRYALKAQIGDRKLCAIRVEPFNLLLYGDPSLLKELLVFLQQGEYEIPGIFAETELGEVFLELAPQILGQEYKLGIGMDFMEAKEITEPTSPEVGIPTAEDVDELYECLVNFIKDCGLSDPVDKEKIRSTLPQFRILRKDGRIVSLAKFVEESEDTMRISDVYTRPEYRGRGLARKVVNAVKNHIFDLGKKATLNVDQKNPISNHLYASLGFTKLFSHGIYLPK